MSRPKGSHSSKETKRKLSLAKRGKPGWWKGKHFSEKHKANLGLGNKGKVRTEEVKQQASLRVRGRGNPNFGNYGPKPNITKAKLFNKYGFNEIPETKVELIKEMILNNFPGYEIAKATELSSYLISSVIVTNFPELLEIHKSNCKLYHKPYRGHPNPNKGKSYLEIFGDEDKARKRAKVTSDWMKTEKNIRRFVKHPSKPQMRLFDFIKNIFPHAVSEYPIPKGDNIVYLDIALPEDKIDFEYDEPYWHNSIVNRDSERDNYISQLGWSVIRIKGEKELNEFICI